MPERGERANKSGMSKPFPTKSKQKMIISAGGNGRMKPKKEPKMPDKEMS